MKTTFVSAGLTLVCCATLFSGCGLADLGASAATQGASAAEQAKEAKKLEDKVQQRLDEANKVAAEQRAAAEQASQ